MMTSGPTSTTRRRFVLATIGSRGDLYPLLAIGRALVARGHHVTVATLDRFREIVVEGGMAHHTLRPDPLLDDSNPLLQGVSPRKRDGAFAVRHLMYPRVEETYRDLLSAAKDADLIAFPMFIFSGPMAAERLGIPWAAIHAAPGTFYSEYDPPYLPPVSWLYPLQRMSPLVPKLFNPLARLAIRSWAKPLHELREREGFPREKGDLLLGGMRSPWLTLALFSSCIGAEQPDWPRPSAIAGFPFFDEAVGGHDEALERFLADGEPPLVVSLGSLISEDRRGFLENMIDVAQRLGRRLLLIAGPDGDALRRKYSCGSLMIVDYLPYSLVFPRACAVVIVGSVGPISHALRAARPMLVISSEEIPDQPDNALRVERLGAGRWLRLKHCTVKSLESNLRSLLSDRGYARNAERWGAQVNAEDGIASACDALEAVAGRRGVS